MLMEPQPSLQLEEVDLGYSSSGTIRPVLNGLQLGVYGGGVCAIVGRNGVGKTTLLRTVVGLIPKVNGCIRINGIELEQWTPANRARQVSILLNRSLADRSIAVHELILLGRTPYRNRWDAPLPDDLEKLEFYLDLFELGSLRNRSCFELSDGQYQKVLLARTLIQECPLVLLDEPTAHLDPYQKLLLFELLRETAGKLGTRFLVSTHEVDLAWKFCDHWWILDGRNNPQLEVDPESSRPDLSELYATSAGGPRE